jgi:predicted ThiF/HesA family dinucleotide-utilizing enzyme
MAHTIELLEKALEVRNAAQWCNRFNVTRATITNAKKRGRLSPTLAGVFALEMGENPIYWTAVAAAEAEPPGPLRDRLEETLKRHETALY